MLNTATFFLSLRYKVNNHLVQALIMSQFRAESKRREEEIYNIGDIVELRKPRGILGIVEYIGPKKNRQGHLISNDIHYVIKLASNVGNGNGEWNGFQYTRTLRPDNTMHLCKLNNIRCKRSGYQVLKALYNLLHSHQDMEIESRRQKQYIEELQGINYKLQQHLQAQTYFHHKSSRTNGGPTMAHKPTLRGRQFARSDRRHDRHPTNNELIYTERRRRHMMLVDHSNSMQNIGPVTGAMHRNSIRDIHRTATAPPNAINVGMLYVILNPLILLNELENLISS